MAPPLGPVLSELQRAAALLDELGVGWALVGGLAVSALTDPRFTRDVDLVIACANDAEAERVVLSLRERGYRLALALAHAPSGRLSTVRLVRGEDSAVLLDLLFASSGIEREIAGAAVLMPGLIERPAPISRIGHLIALKLLARDDVKRPLDNADLRALIRAASPAELDLAREAVRLIVARNFNRGRDLEALLDQTLAQTLAENA